jgi:hypothetical protein
MRLHSEPAPEEGTWYSGTVGAPEEAEEGGEEEEELVEDAGEAEDSPGTEKE